MQPRKKALVAAASGTAIGLAGLAFIAMPAGAGEAPPELPAVSAEDLVQSVLTADAPALRGTVTVSEQLGLPAALPGVGSLDLDEARVFNDGNGKTRLAIKQGGTENTVVHDGATVWSYNSADNTATKVTLPEGVEKHEGVTEDGQLTDPTAAAGQLLQAVREFSTVTVDGTARVADRPAYELVLTPKPDERTLLREIRVAVDSETRLPLRLEVLTNGTTEPALEIGFSEFAVEQQPADLFSFTPPAGAKVEEVTPEAKPQDQAEADKVKDAVDPQIVGTGWDSVITGRVPADALTGGQLPTELPEGKDGGEPLNLQALLGQVAKPVSGPFGTGHVITTKVGTALLTDDGRFAAGAVPEQVLIEALGTR